MRETWVQSLGREDPLEKGTATHSSILAWRIPQTEEPGGLHSPWGAGSVPGWGVKIPRGSPAKETKNIKQKQ